MGQPVRDALTFLRHRLRRRGMEVPPRPAGIERIVGPLHVRANRQPGARRELIVEPDATLLLRSRPGLVDVEARERARVGADVGLTLVLEVREVMEPVPQDRPAVGRAELLVGVRQHAILDRVGGVEPVVAEESRHRSRTDVGPRLGDRVHLHAGRAPLPRVEAIGDDLELGDRVLAEAWLAEARRNQLRHLLPVDVQLEARARGLRHKVLLAPGREEREVHPVAAVEWQVLDLLRAHRAAQVRLGHVDQRRFSGHRHGFLKVGRRHLQVHHHLLPHLQLQAGTLQGREPRQLESNPIRADPHRDAVAARAIGDGFEAVSARLVHRRHDDTRQHAAGGIGNRSRNRGFLRVAAGWQQKHQRADQEPPECSRLHQFFLRNRSWILQRAAGIAVAGASYSWPAVNAPASCAGCTDQLAGQQGPRRMWRPILLPRGIIHIR